MVEALNRSTLHLTSISYIYKVFEHLDMLWMGVWVHPYADTSAQGGGEIFGKLGYNLAQVMLTVMVEAVNRSTLHLISISYI
jgi:hypothetical protein